MNIFRLALLNNPPINIIINPTINPSINLVDLRYLRIINDLRSSIRFR